ncbi:tetrameric acyl-CoA thioesterase [Lysobacteraceae bacterium NML120232]|nr:tetrameric acyl-CoA thioesterase [Xanthomonadaceae bacterium NML08-0793]PJK12602.1 tetrameric acyl-CoA thioesterase [Xanthomonadaceae bacterium NML120232]
MTPRIFRFGINLWPPFLFSGIHMTHLAQDWRKVQVELRLRPWNRNYVGTQYGGNLFSMTDPMWMLMILHSVPRGYRVWDKAAEIEFIKPGRSTVRAEFVLTDEILDELLQAAANGQKVLRWFETDILDADGDVVARVRKQIYLRKKPAPLLPP